LLKEADVVVLEKSDEKIDEDALVMMTDEGWA
jgi:hypothetical protein